MKKTIGVIVGMLLLVLLMSVPSYAMPRTSYAMLRNIPEFVIEKFEDGRVKPRGIFEQLTVHQVERILFAMGFREEEIGAMPYDVRESTARYGGKKVEITSEVQAIFYHDIDGNVHEVNDDNYKYFLALSRQEYTQLNEEEGSFTPQLIIYDDGHLQIGRHITYLGTTSTERRYRYSVYYNYRSYQNTGSEHVMNLAWQSHTTRFNSDIYARYNHYGKIVNSLKSTNFVIGATTAKAWNVHAKEQWGSLSHEVRIPLRHVGETGEIIYEYARPSNLLYNLSIGPLSIQWSGFSGWRFQRHVAFTIQ